MRDKAKQKLRQHESYLRNKERHAAQTKARRQERKNWYYEFMKDKSCKFCPENSTECLDWHHLDPSTKEGQVAYMVRKRRPFDVIFKEMAKCIIVCANCHRKIHANTLQYARLITSATFSGKAAIIRR